MKQNKAQSILEYSLIMGLIVLAIIIGLSLMGTTVSDIYTTLNGYLGLVS